MKGLFKKDEKVRFSLCLCVFVLALVLPVGLFAEGNQLVFLPNETAFQSLVGDPREPHDSITLRSGANPYEGAIGTYTEFLQWRPGDGSRWGFGILGAGFIGLGTAGATDFPARAVRIGNYLYYDTFPDHVTDWYLGVYFSESLGAFSNRFEYTHVSSHLGDEFFDYVDRFVYTRESFRFTSAFQPDEGLRIYAGAGYYPHIDPADNRFFLHAGTELYSSYMGFIAGTVTRGYFTYDIKVKGEAGGVVNQAFQLGFQWKAKKESHHDVRIALVGYLGNSEYGQFYQQRDDYWGVGFYFDP